MCKLAGSLLFGTALVIGLLPISGCSKGTTQTPTEITRAPEPEPDNPWRPIQGGGAIKDDPTGGDKDVLFNGRDLDNWDYDSNYWSVKNGVIVGAVTEKGKGATFLCSSRVYRNFEFKLEVKLTGKGANSGINIRSILKDPGKFVVEGPQCDIIGSGWGTLQGVKNAGKGGGGKGGGGKGGAKGNADKGNADKGNADKGGGKGGKKGSTVKENAFNDFEIKCVGNYLTVKVNGEATLDGEFDLPPDGIIAFQLDLKSTSKVEFKNLEFKELK